MELEDIMPDNKSICLWYKSKSIEKGNPVYDRCINKCEGYRLGCVSYHPKTFNKANNYFIMGLKILVKEFSVQLAYDKYKQFADTYTIKHSEMKMYAHQFGIFRDYETKMHETLFRFVRRQDK